MKQISHFEKEYLGDGVYACLDRGMIMLTTEDGINTTNSIFLEPDVFYALIQYKERHFKALTDITDAKEKQ